MRVFPHQVIPRILNKNSRGIQNAKFNLLDCLRIDQSIQAMTIFFFCILFPITSAQAACSSPSGVASQTRYDSSANKMYYCNNTDWVQMGGGGSLPTCAEDNIPVAKGGVWVCSDDASNTFTVRCRHDYAYDTCTSPTGCFSGNDGVNNNATNTIISHYGSDTSVTIIANDGTAHTCGGSGGSNFDKWYRVTTPFKF